MPVRSLRPCGKYPCPRLNEPGSRYCGEHLETDKERDRQYKQADPFCKSRNCAAWRSARAATLARDPICRICGRAASTDADHVIPARIWCARGGEFYDLSNLQGLCHECHSQKTAREVGARWGR